MPASTGPDMPNAPAQTIAATRTITATQTSPATSQSATLAARTDAQATPTPRLPLRAYSVRLPAPVPTGTPVGDVVREPLPTLTPIVVLVATPAPESASLAEDNPTTASTERLGQAAAITNALAPMPAVAVEAVTTPAAVSPSSFLGELPSFALPELGQNGPDDTYIVRDGDTLWSVAIEMGLDLEEAGCAVSPHFTLDHPLVVGDTLHAPGAGVICHRVDAAQTPIQIAHAYGIAPADLIGEAWNQLSLDMAGKALPLGTHVRVPITQNSEAQSNPDGFMAFMLEQPVSVSPYLAYATGGPRVKLQHEPVPAHWPYGSGQFEWPVYGWLSQGYRNDHRAIDIAAQRGTFVTASDRGMVIRAGWNNQGYGRFVVIDHNIDYITLYAHLEQILVQEGEVVGKGQIIGTVGSTGNSTGPHLHFEIRDFGRRTNPIELLVR